MSKCNHMMVRVRSSAGDREGYTRKLCARPGCFHEEKDWLIEKEEEPDKEGH
jgi:hypothetical protein